MKKLDKVKLLYFGAMWCMPCRQMKPILEQIEEDYPDLVIERIDIEKHADIKDKYSVMSLPTVVIEKEEKEVARLIGVSSKEKIMASVL